MPDPSEIAIAARDAKKHEPMRMVDFRALLALLLQKKEPLLERPSPRRRGGAHSRPALIASSFFPTPIQEGSSSPKCTRSENPQLRVFEIAVVRLRGRSRGERTSMALVFVLEHVCQACFELFQIVRAEGTA